MRLLELYEQMLLEHNVVNTDAITRYVSQFASQCHNQNAAEWFNVTLARYLERHDQINVPMTDDAIPRNAPDWLDGAFSDHDAHGSRLVEHGLNDCHNWFWIEPMDVRALAAAARSNEFGECRATF